MSTTFIRIVQLFVGALVATCGSLAATNTFPQWTWAFTLISGVGAAWLTPDPKKLLQKQPSATVEVKVEEKK